MPGRASPNRNERSRKATLFGFGSGCGVDGRGTRGRFRATIVFPDCAAPKRRPQNFDSQNCNRLRRQRDARATAMRNTNCSRSTVLSLRRFGTKSALKLVAEAWLQLMPRELILLTNPCSIPGHDAESRLIELPQQHGLFRPNAGLIQLEIERANKCFPLPLYFVRAVCPRVVERASLQPAPRARTRS